MIIIWIFNLICFTTTLISGCLILFLASPLWIIHRKSYYKLVKYTQETSFTTAILFLSGVIPSKIVLYADDSVDEILNDKGQLCLEKNSILICNHQVSPIRLKCSFI